MSAMSHTPALTTNDDIFSGGVVEAVIKELPIQRETTEHARILDKGSISLFVLGSVVFVAGLATGIWPIALAGLGPWLLLVIDSCGRKWGGVR